MNIERKNMWIIQRLTSTVLIFMLPAFMVGAREATDGQDIPDSQENGEIQDKQDVIPYAADTAAAGDSSKEEKFRIGLVFSAHWGRVNTIVYDNSDLPDLNNNPYYSLLGWDLMSIYSLGVEGKWEYARKAYIDFALRPAFKGQDAGQMDDFDWFYSDRDWSHWSLHDINIKWGLTADLFSSWELISASPFSLGLGFGYHLDWWEWTDRQVDNIYSKVENENKNYPRPYPRPDEPAFLTHGFRNYKYMSTVGKNMIDNSVFALVLAASLDLNLKWEILYLRFLGRAGPVFLYGEDHHKLRSDGGPDGIIFYDYALAPWVEAQLEVGITLGAFVLSVRGEYAFAPPIPGIQHSVYSNNRPDGYAIGGGSLSLNRFTVSTLVSWRI